MDLTPHTGWFRKRLLERFLRYVRYDTTSDRHSPDVPSTSGQRVFAETLLGEIRKLGIEHAALDDNCYLYARLPAQKNRKSVPPFGLIAHLDTSADAPGNAVNPLVHENYDGKPLRLSNGITLDTEGCADLAAYKGTTVITSDGTSLLGADDKAGIAEIMTALEFLTLHPEAEHGPIEVVFTPDEETGRGMDRFPHVLVHSRFCVTLDGSGDGLIESECFTAYAVSVTVEGRAIHLGEARGRLVNAIKIASQLVMMLPGQESPEAADGRYGYYAPIEIMGDLEKAMAEFLIRDFDESECKRRIATIEAAAAALEKIFPGSRITVSTRKQYSNMKSFFGKREERLLGLLGEAVKESGIQPRYGSIRGGTDGARLSELGTPTPNLFTGGFNYHSRNEWAALDAMARAVHTVLVFSRLWLEESKH